MLFSTNMKKKLIYIDIGRVKKILIQNWLIIFLFIIYNHQTFKREVVIEFSKE